MLPGKRFTGPDFARPSPSLRLAFAIDKALDSRITFTRASSATYFDASGVMQTASTNVARFTHNPDTLQSLGLLIEESRTNLLTYSEQFDNAAWTKTGATISANAASAPDATTTADKIVESAATASHRVSQAISVTSGKTYTTSVFVKAAERSIFQIFYSSGEFGLNAYANFNLASGSVGTVGSAATASMKSAGGGWYTCILSVPATATNAASQAFFQIVPSTTSARAEQYAGDGTSGIYVWGAQCEAGSFATSYIPTTSATVTRAADNASMTGSNFSDWYNQSEGTFVVKGVQGGTAATSRVILEPSNGANTERLQFYGSGVEKLKLFIADGGVTQADLGTRTSTIGAHFAAAGSYKANDINLSVGGLATESDTLASIPSPTLITIGGKWDGLFKLGGTIASIDYYPKAYPGFLQYITAGGFQLYGSILDSDGNSFVSSNNIASVSRGGFLAVSTALDSDGNVFSIFS